MNNISGRPLRTDHAIISEWVNAGSRVLDLGCGDGGLLAHLAKTRNASGYGIEIEEAQIATCLRRGINVIQSDLDEGLAEFNANTFDHVILSMTLQSITYPDKLVDEMLRVGKEGIITFPNFAYWSPRLQLALKGRMPVNDALPFQWYDTPNIHLCTIKDFEKFCAQRDIRILERKTSDTKNESGGLSRLWPNFFGEVALYRFTKN